MKYPIAVAEYAEVRDAAGVLVALCFSREDAKLIVDLANAAEVQRVRGWYAYPSTLMDKTFWSVAGMACQDEREFGKNNHDTHHTAILAADKWLKAKGQANG